MGASESKPEGDSLAPKQGYHVIRVAQKSPAQIAGFEPFFDFCIGINGLPLTDLGIDIPQGVNTQSRNARAKWSMVEANEGRTIVLNVWNSKQQEFRDVRIVPSRAWSQISNETDAQPSLLGLTLRLCNPMDTISHTWHILDVVEGSPADSAGLVPFGDYIIGWTGGPLQGEGDFFQLVEQSANTNLSLYVYNSDYDHTREVVIVPNRDWGGEGLLGCGIGYGLLRTYHATHHADRIPKPRKQWEDSVLEATEVEPDNSSLAPSAPMHHPLNTYETSYDGFEPEDTYNFGVTVSMHQDEEE